MFDFDLVVRYNSHTHSENDTLIGRTSKMHLIIFAHEFLPLITNTVTDTVTYAFVEHDIYCCLTMTVLVPLRV